MIILNGKRERAGCFALFVFLVSRDCCVAIPLSAMGLSAICDCDTHLLFLGVIHANSDCFWRVCTFAWSSLSLCHISKFSCGDSNGD